MTVKNRINFLNMTAENPVDQSVEACIEESEAVMHPTVDAALRNAGIKPSEVRLWKAVLEAVLVENQAT